MFIEKINNLIRFVAFIFLLLHKILSKNQKNEKIYINASETNWCKPKVTESRDIFFIAKARDNRLKILYNSLHKSNRKLFFIITGMIVLYLVIKQKRVSRLKELDSKLYVH